jgi:hypothetical protein
MTKYHLFLFDETTKEQFFGYNREVNIPELPVWGNYKVQDLLAISNMQSLSVTSAPLASSEDVQRVISILEDHTAMEGILVGRNGNIVVLDWFELLSGLGHPRGITKIQIGKVPTEFYSLRRKDFIHILKGSLKRKRGETSGFLQHVFETVLFFNFERISECSGYSFLLRNSYEYYQENLRIIEHLRDSSFLRLYGALKTSSISGTIVGKNAVIKNSFLGNGTKVDGFVEESVIFSGVTVGKNAIIKNSVILPFNQVEKGVRIENALVLGRSNRVIEEGAFIGRSADTENGDFPEVIKRGLTILGEGVNIPAGSRIGAGCLIQGVLDKSPQPFVVDDGKTLVFGRDRAPE